MATYNARKSINPRMFGEEMMARGLSLPVAWGSDGLFEIPDSIAPEDMTQLLAVIAAHDPAEAAIQESRRRALDRITERRDAALRALTVEFSGATFNADEASVQRMTSASIMLERFSADPRAPSTVSWLDAGNTPRSLTPTQLSELAAAAWLATQAVWARNHAAKVAIEAARTVEEIEAVGW